MDKLSIGVAIVTLLMWNLAVFFTYGADKRKAKKGKWRIPESVLLTMALFMGAVGALLGMKYYHHKTKHLKFKIGVPLCLIFNIAIIVMVVLTAMGVEIRL